MCGAGFMDGTDPVVVFDTCGNGCVCETDTGGGLQQFPVAGIRGTVNLILCGTADFRPAQLWVSVAAQI